MEQLIWIVVIAALFAAGVAGGFWVITRAGYKPIVGMVFGGLVLVIILFALVYLARYGVGGSPVLYRDPLR